MDVNPLSVLCVAMLCAYTVPACYYDLKYREIPSGFWTVLLTACVPSTAILYWFRVYPWYLLLLSVAMIGLYAGLCYLNLFEGADFQFLALISLFFVQSPMTGNYLMPVPFGIFLIASIMCCAISYQMIPQVKEWLMKYNAEQVPMMVPISLAVWLTVILA